MNETSQSNRLDIFERKVVFRTARGYFLLLSFIALLTFVAGVFFGARGLMRPEPNPPAEPVLPSAPPPPAALTAKDVQTWLQRQKTSTPSVVTPPEESEPLVKADRHSKKDRASEKLARVVGELKALFPAPTYSWEDTYIRKCVSPSPYGCLRYTRSRDKEGIDKIVSDAVSPVLRAHAPDQLMAVLRQLVAVLRTVPVEKRAGMIAPTVEAYREAQADYLRRLQAHDDQVAQAQAKYEQRRSKYESRLAAVKKQKQEDRSDGLYGVLLGVGLIVLVSVFLAHFAIERHLRLLREIAADLGRGLS